MFSQIRDGATESSLLLLSITGVVSGYIRTIETETNNVFIAYTLFGNEEQDQFLFQYRKSK